MEHFKDNSGCSGPKKSEIFWNNSRKVQYVFAGADRPALLICPFLGWSARSALVHCPFLGWSARSALVLCLYHEGYSK